MGITNKYLSLIITATIIVSTSCKKNDSPPPQVPQVSIAGIASITSSSAVAGGSIISNGRLEISSSGFCWSKNNPLPSIYDDTTKTTVRSGEFTSEISGLDASSQYFIRSYAINGQGTGYSEVMTFNTGNAPPVVNNIQIEGSVWVGSELKVEYDYFDAENDVESNSVIRWFTAVDTIDFDTTTEASTGVLYKPIPTDESRFIKVGVTPIAATGSLAGTERLSYWVGPVGPDPTIVTFLYNGAEVTYGVIISPISGRNWLDRNLGAPNAPGGYNEFPNFGDLFQWGRVPDGHQLIIRQEFSGVPLTGFTQELASSDIPSHSLFIINPNSPYDWRVPQNDNLWQESGINNPCPAGWHIPTLEEWKAEGFSSKHISHAWNQLRLTLTGYRYGIDGNVSDSESLGLYWTSTPVDGGGFNMSYEMIFGTDNDPNPVTTDIRAGGAACRCIKDVK
jgi:hypothetical protein